MIQNENVSGIMAVIDHKGMFHHTKEMHHSRGRTRVMHLLGLPRSWYSVSFLRAVKCVTILSTLGFADGILWPAVPNGHTNVEQGRHFSLRWYYEMDGNETFLSSEIEQNVKKSYSPMALRHGEPNTYEKYSNMGDSLLFSIFGKNNVTLSVPRAPSAGIENNITYCCKVVCRTIAGLQEDKRCSRVFVYAVPRITYLTTQLSCKQRDSIKLHCNTTGIPSPCVEWIHNDTHQRIGSSSHILLNITGKRSGGRYCCVADNGYGNQTACTVVNVTEYEPVNTKLSVKLTNILDVNMIRIKCEAVASPPANRFIMTIDDKQYNSSDGLYTIKVPAARKDKIYHIAVSCIPCNKYGQGPIKKVFFPVYALPTFIAPLPTLYNMTIRGITLKCETKGIPTPTITWISGDSGDIVSTGKYYNVSYVKCTTKTMTFFCHARNVMGNISSPEIRVNVMTKRNCSTADKGLDETTPTALKLTMITAITFACISFVGIVVVAVRFWRRIKASKVKNMNENIYQDPIDAVDLEREGPLSLARITSINDDYATVEECGVTQLWTHVVNNAQSEGEEPLYERLVPSEI